MLTTCARSGQPSPTVSPALLRSLRAGSSLQSQSLDESTSSTLPFKTVARPLVAGQAALDASLIGSFASELARAADEHAEVCTQTATLLLKQRKVGALANDLRCITFCLCSQRSQLREAAFVCASI
jgi:hypothetical protein